MATPIQRPPNRAVAIMSADLESVALHPWLATGAPVFDAGDVVPLRAAVEDAGATLVAVSVGDGWRCYAREADCLVSLTGPDLVNVDRAVESVRRLARACREVGT